MNGTKRSFWPSFRSRGQRLETNRSQDRLTTPLLRKRGGVYAKDGDFEPVSWEEAVDVMADHAKQV